MEITKDNFYEMQDKIIEDIKNVNTSNKDLKLLIILKIILFIFY